MQKAALGMRDDVADAGTRKAIEAFMRAIYQHRLTAIGLEPSDEEPVDTALLRSALVNFLALEAHVLTATNTFAAKSQIEAATLKTLTAAQGNLTRAKEAGSIKPDEQIADVRKVLALHNASEMIKLVLRELRDEGRIILVGRGRGARWVRNPHTEQQVGKES